MTRIYNIALVALIVLAGTVGVETAEAGKSTNVTINNVPKLYYLSNDSPVYSSIPLTTTPPCEGGNLCHLHGGLERGSSASVVYKAKLIDAATGFEINDNSSVPVGTRFRVERDESTKNRDVFWNGTGLSMDTPYGRWVSDAGPVTNACEISDRLASFSGPTGIAGVYVLLNVAPPALELTNVSSNLSCSGFTCTVTDTGRISVGLNFVGTNGRFYYRYSQSIAGRVGCHGNNAPMNAGYNLTTVRGIQMSSCVGNSCLNATPYDLPIPARAIIFNLTGTPGTNRPPANPTITPSPHSGFTNVSYPFTIQGTDPDNDQIRYQVDINNTLTPDLNIPSSGFINSGTAQTYTRAFPAPGTYVINVRSIDSEGAVSPGWGQTVVTITAPQTPTVVTNPATIVTPTTARFNGTVDPNGSPATGWFRYSTTNPGTCNDTFGTRVPTSGGTNLGGGSSAVALNQNVSGLSAHTTYYFCAIGSNTHGNGFGTVRSMNTTNSLPTAIITTPTGPQTIPEGTPITFTGEGTDPDGDPITTYEWDTTCTIGGGSLSGNSTFDISSLAPGTHTIYLMVQDNQTGGWSTNCPHVVITVTPVSGPSCPQTTINHCDLPVTPEGGSAGICSPGYDYGTSDCSYSCITGGSGVSVWDEANGTNTCTPPPPVLVTEFKVCDPGETNCVSSGTKTVNAGDPLEVHWDSENATVCVALSGTEFQTGNAVRGTDPANATAVLDTTEQYSVACKRNNEPYVVKSVTVKTRGAGPSLVAKPRVVKEGDPTVLTWDTNTSIETACSLTGGGLNLPNLPSGGDPKTGSTSAVINARTTFTLSCPDPSNPTGPRLIDTVTVEVISKGFET